MNKLKAILMLVLVNLTVLAFTQSVNEAGDMFNQAIQSSKEANYGAAVDAYLKTIKICDQLGDEGTDLKIKAEQQLASSYYNLAKSQYTEKKYTEALETFDKAANAAITIGNDKTRDASYTYIAGINTSYGNSYYKKEEYEKAIEKFNKALQVKPDYIKAVYGLGIVYKKQDDLDKMKETMDKAIAMGGEGDKTAAKAKSVAGTAFFNAGATALQEGANQKAFDYLSSATQYKESDPKTYYYMAVASNNLSKWDDAITAANKAIELGCEEPSDAHFMVGQAFEGKGDKTAACGAYKKVTSGDNAAAAKYQITQVLKCN